MTNTNKKSGSSPNSNSSAEVGIILHPGSTTQRTSRQTAWRTAMSLFSSRERMRRSGSLKKLLRRPRLSPTLRPTIIFLLTKIFRRIVIIEFSSSYGRGERKKIFFVYLLLVFQLKKVRINSIYISYL